MSYKGGVPWPGEVVAASATMPSRSAAPEHGGSATDSTLYCKKSQKSKVKNVYLTKNYT